MRTEPKFPLIVPASVSQARVVEDHRRSENPRIFDVPVYLRIRGPLDQERLVSSLVELIARHSALRTTFSRKDGKLLQIVHRDPLEKSVSFLDLRDRSVAGKGVHEIIEILTEEGVPVYPDEESALFMANLAQVAEADFFLIMVFDHAIVDEYSVALLSNELSELYGGNGDKLTTPGIFHEMVPEETELSAAIEHWRRELLPRPPRPFLQVNEEKVRGAFDAGICPVEYPDEIGAEVQKAAKACRTTPFVILLAALYAALWRATSATDLAVAVPMDGRTDDLDFSTVGFFQNLVIMRVQMDRTTSFEGLVSKVRDKYFGAIRYRGVPYADVVQALVPEASGKRNKFTQIAFSFSSDKEEWRLPGLEVETLSCASEEAQIELMFEMRHSSRGVDGSVSFATGILGEENVKSILGDVQVFLNALSENPPSLLFQVMPQKPQPSVSGHSR